MTMRTIFEESQISRTNERSDRAILAWKNSGLCQCSLKIFTVEILLRLPEAYLEPNNCI